MYTLALYSASRSNTMLYYNLRAHSMSYTLTVDKERKLLMVTYCELVTLHDRKMALHQGTLLMNTHSLASVLTDFRKAIIGTQTVESLVLGELLSKTIAMRGKKNAFLVRAGQTGNRFTETVAVNRGYIAKTFTDVHEACKWLGIEPLPMEQENPPQALHESTSASPIYPTTL